MDISGYEMAAVIAAFIGGMALLVHGWPQIITINRNSGMNSHSGSNNYKD